MRRREQQHVALAAEIKDTARRLMTEHGTASVSLRMIARELDMSAPSLYHYYENYDALITALLVDAFNALADALEQTRVDALSQPPANGMLAVAEAYRAWALRHPLDFQLIYGNPIPGYVAPREATVPTVVRAFTTLTTQMNAALATVAVLPEFAHVPLESVAHLEAMRAQYGYGVSREALYATNVLWSRIHGIVMLELFNHIQPAVGNVDAFYHAQIMQLLRDLGMQLDT